MAYLLARADSHDGLVRWEPDANAVVTDLTTMAREAGGAMIAELIRLVRKQRRRGSMPIGSSWSQMAICRALAVHRDLGDLGEFPGTHRVVLTSSATRGAASIVALAS